MTAFVAMARFLSFLAAASLAACSAASTSPSADAGVVSSGQGGLLDASRVDGSDSLCAADPRAEVFTPGLLARGASGALSVRLEAMVPGAPAKGDNDWTIAVVDAAGAPVDGLVITVKPYMPDHGHPSSITPRVAPLGSGEYDVKLNLFMAGIWTVTLTLGTPVDGGPATAVDSAVFTFCVSG